MNEEAEVIIKARNTSIFRYAHSITRYILWILAYFSLKSLNEHELYGKFLKSCTQPNHKLIKGNTGNLYLKMLKHLYC